MPLHHITRELTPLGVVVALSGVVAIVGLEGFKRILKLGDNVNEGDTVVTGDEGEITIGFADGTSIEVGRDSQLTVEADLFDAPAFKGNVGEILQSMRNAIHAGEPANNVLDAASRGDLAQIDYTHSNYVPGGNESPLDNTQPGIGDGPGTSPPGTPPPVVHPPEQLPEITISDVIVKEPAVSADHVQGSGAGTLATAEFNVTLSEPSSEDVTLHFRTVDGSAVSTGQGGVTLDYQHDAGVLTIPAGETSATINIVINGDDLVEGSENFAVHLHHVSNATLADNQGVGVIVDNEPSGQGGGSGGLSFGGSDDTPGNNEPTDGDDILHGTGGHDVLTGQAGGDVIFGAGGDDTIRGGHDDDLLIGGAGDDVLIGNIGDDILLGQVGDDVLSGNSGDDILIGGRGEDTLAGGGGRDIFRYTDLSEAGDVITDFKLNHDDAIDISELLDGYSDGADLSTYVNLLQEGGDLELHVDPSGGSDFTLLVTLQDAASQLSNDPVDLVAEGSLIINSNTVV